MDAQGGHYTAYLGHDHIHGYPEDLVHRPDVHPFDWIADRALELGLIADAAGVDIAAETDAPFFSPRGLPGPAGATSDMRPWWIRQELVNWVRVIKSPASRRRCGPPAPSPSGSWPRRSTPSRPAGASATSSPTSSTPRRWAPPTLGGDYPAVVPMLPDRRDRGHPAPDVERRPVRQGEATTIELAGVPPPLPRAAGPHGQPRAAAPRLAAVADALPRPWRHAQALRPGSTGHDVHAAFTEVISRHGLSKESRIGYSIGIGYPPDWGERTISLRAEDETEIAAGMAFHVILGIWMDGWGYETSEPVLVTEGGAEPLTHLPRGLTVKD